MSENKSEITKNGFLLLSRYRGAVMGMAAIMIFVFHGWISVIPKSPNAVISFLHDTEFFIRRVSYFGVDIFFLISGMGLTYAIKKDPLPKFYYRRLRRIYLPYLAAVLVSTFINKWSFLTFLGHATGYTFYAEHVNSYCWFVPAIITFYIFFPLYCKAFDKAKNKFVFTTLVILIWLAISIAVAGFMRIDLYSFTNRIPVFITGIYFGYLAQRKDEIVFKARHYLLLIFTLAIGLFLYYVYVFLGFSLFLPEGKLFLPNIIMSVSLSLLVAKLIDILMRRVTVLGKIVNYALGFWGKFSLELYLVYICLLVPFFGMFVLALSKYHLTALPVNLIVFAISSAIAWTAAHAFQYFWKLVELPFSHKKTETK
ncbi:MAG: acyltransferase [Ruminococcaceae bacterium]|nr:acyltransferase [Oscillospiraceae bacterium]